MLKVVWNILELWFFWVIEGNRNCFEKLVSLENIGWISIFFVRE